MRRCMGIGASILVFSATAYLGRNHDAIWDDVHDERLVRDSSLTEYTRLSSRRSERACSASRQETAFFRGAEGCAPERWMDGFSDPGRLHRETALFGEGLKFRAAVLRPPFRSGPRMGQNFAPGPTLRSCCRCPEGVWTETCPHGRAGCTARLTPRLRESIPPFIGE